MAEASGAGMNPAGWSSGAASGSGAWLPTVAGALGPAGAAFLPVAFFPAFFFPAPFFPVPFLAVAG